MYMCGCSDRLLAGHLFNSGSQHRTRIERVDVKAQCQTPARGVGAESLTLKMRVSLLGVDRSQLQSKSNVQSHYQKSSV